MSAKSKTENQQEFEEIWKRLEDLEEKEERSSADDIVGRYSVSSFSVNYFKHYGMKKIPIA